MAVPDRMDSSSAVSGRQDCNPKRKENGAFGPPGIRAGFWSVVGLCCVCLALGFAAARSTYLRQSEASVSEPTRPAASRVVEPQAARRPAPALEARTKATPPPAQTAASAAPANSAPGADDAFEAPGVVDVARPDYPLQVTSRLSEPVMTIHVQEGDIVQPGQLMISLDPKMRQSSVACKERRLAMAKLELEKLQAGYRREDVQAAEARLREATEQLRFAQLSYDRLKNLGRDALSQTDLDRSLVTLRAAEARHAEATAMRDKLLAGYAKEEIAIAQAAVAEASSEVEMARLDLGDCSIRAPGNHPPLKVLSIHRKVGEGLNANTPSLLELYDPKDMQVRVDLQQSELQHVHPGDPVTFKVTALPDRSYQGTVLRFDAQFQSGKSTITVRVRIEDPDDRLLPEMAGEVLFHRSPDAPTGSDPQGKS
jgi:HlyD family secretion protein